MQDFSGKLAVVTGAGSGMGRATAEVFAAEGAFVALTDLAGSAIEDIAADLLELSPIPVLVAKGMPAIAAE